MESISAFFCPRKVDLSLVVVVVVVVDLIYYDTVTRSRNRDLGLEMRCFLSLVDLVQF